MFDPDLIGRLVAVALVQSCGDVLLCEGCQSLSQLRDGGEVSNPEQLFFACANGALGEPVDLGLTARSTQRRAFARLRTLLRAQNT